MTRGTEPAAHSHLATLWGQVSRTHHALHGRLRYFETTAADDRLSEQLSHLPVLHEREPMSVSEVEELTYLLGLYVEPMTVEEREEAAREAAASVRRMTVRRGASEPPHRVSVQTPAAVLRPAPPARDAAASHSPEPVRPETDRPVIPRQRTGDERLPAPVEDDLVDPLAPLRELTDHPPRAPVRDRRAPRDHHRRLVVTLAAALVLALTVIVALLV